MSIEDLSDEIGAEREMRRRSQEWFERNRKSGEVVTRAPAERRRPLSESIEGEYLHYVYADGEERRWHGEPVVPPTRACDLPPGTYCIPVNGVPEES
jgi:hypothetical protein